GRGILSRHDGVLYGVVSFFVLLSVAFVLIWQRRLGDFFSVLMRGAWGAGQKWVRAMRSRILFATVLALGAGASAQVSPHISSLLKRADNGDVVAQFTLARAYQDGREVKRDHAQALKWYQKAADRGEPASQCN